MKARALFSKALCGVEQVFELNHARCKTARAKSCALDAMMKNGASIEV